MCRWIACDDSDLWRGIVGRGLLRGGLGSNRFRCSPVSARLACEIVSHCPQLTHPQLPLCLIRRAGKTNGQRPQLASLAPFRPQGGCAYGRLVYNSLHLHRRVHHLSRSTIRRVTIIIPFHKTYNQHRPGKPSVVSELTRHLPRVRLGRPGRPLRPGTPCALWFLTAFASSPYRA